MAVFSHLAATMVWQRSEISQRLYMLEAGDIIHPLCLSPLRYWLAAATQKCFKVWDLESKSVVDELKPESLLQEYKRNAQEPYCTSLAWSTDSPMLYAGYTNGNIYGYVVSLAEALAAQLHQRGQRMQSRAVNYNLHQIKVIITVD
jgi:guanine nucleotide-binding protein subunit beta-2-like 1 protein